MSTKRETLINLYKKYGLEKEDVFKHQHFTIITRSGIEKIIRAMNITVNYDVENSTPDYCLVKAYGTMGDVTIETLGSAKHGNTPTSKGDGNTTSWYVAEVSEKRAMSRICLKLAGLYEHNHFGFDEIEGVKVPTKSQQTSDEVKRLCDELKDNSCTLVRAKEIMEDMQEREAENPNSPWVAVIDVAIDMFGDLSHQEVEPNFLHSRYENE